MSLFLDLDRVISFAEVDITHIRKYTVTKVKPDEISWDDLSDWLSIGMDILKYKRIS